MSAPTTAQISGRESCVSPFSSIKPFLQRLSGSGNALEGLTIERVIEGANADYLHDPVGPSRHVVVISTSSPARLDWKMDGRQRSSHLRAGDIIINPKGNFVAPRWSDPVEFLLVGVDAAFYQDACQQWGLPSCESRKSRILCR